MSTREVLVVSIKDKPGELGKVAQKMASAEVNIDFVYIATRNRLVLGVDDPEKAIVALDDPQHQFRPFTKGYSLL